MRETKGVLTTHMTISCGCGCTHRNIYIYVCVCVCVYVCVCVRCVGCVCTPTLFDANVQAPVPLFLSDCVLFSQVEATSMASVDPPNVTYKSRLPRSIADNAQVTI